jgi:hypothetical protein
MAPLRVRVTVRERFEAASAASGAIDPPAEAELAPLSTRADCVDLVGPARS